MAQILGAAPAERQSNNAEPIRRHHPVRYYWLTAGLATVIYAIIMSASTSSSPSLNQPAYSGGGSVQQGPGDMGPSGGDVPSGFQGQWQGMLSHPGYPSNQVELYLQSGGLHQVVGQMVNKTTGRTSDVSGAITGTTLTLHLAQRWIPGYGGGQATAEVQWLGTYSLWITRGGGPVPLSGRLSRVG